LYCASQRFGVPLVANNSSNVPTNEFSYFQPLEIERASPYVRLLQHETSTNRVYGIDSITNLMINTWQSRTNAPGNGGTLDFYLLPESQTEFYRSNVNLPE
jgi:hypothetical protein